MAGKMESKIKIPPEKMVEKICPESIWNMEETDDLLNCDYIMFTRTIPVSTQIGPQEMLVCVCDFADEKRINHCVNPITKEPLHCKVRGFKKGEEDDMER